jgi:aminoglycoside phosphotransferase (APT) family kinase protein
VTSRIPHEIGAADLRAHPVHAAWERLRMAPCPIAAIEVWREMPTHQPASIYRLRLRNDEPFPVFAKRCDAVSGAVERMCYEDIVPRLGMASPIYLGSVQEPDGTVWFFVEDVGREKLSPLDPMHRTLAACWLARLHRMGARVEAGRRLPDGGPRHYLRCLRESRARIERGLANPALNCEQRELLGRIPTTLDRIEDCWDTIVRATARLPETVVHGDFRPKNVRIRHAPSGPVLYALDWELAGWGVPVADLAPARKGIDQLPFDPLVYAAEVVGHGPRLDAAAIRQLSMVGCVMRRLAAMEWESLSLHFEDPACLSTPVSSLRSLQAQLTAVLERAPEWLE